jgi:hypothetical protein
LVAVALASCTSADQPNCPAGGLIPLEVKVVDATTGEFICDAMVTATSGESSYSVGDFSAPDAGESPSTCTYYDTPANFRAGSYTISASAVGFASAQKSDVVIGTADDGCGASFATTATVTLSLVPSP